MAYRLEDLPFELGEEGDPLILVICLSNATAYPIKVKVIYQDEEILPPDTCWAESDRVDLWGTSVDSSAGISLGKLVVKFSKRGDLVLKKTELNSFVSTVLGLLAPYKTKLAPIKALCGWDDIMFGTNLP